MDVKTRGRRSKIGEVGFYCGMLALAFTASFALRVLIHLVSFHFGHHYAGRPAPNLSMLAFDCQRWVTFFPAPWLLFAIVALWGDRRSTRTLVMFSSTLILSLVTFSIIMAVALAFPYLDVIRAGGR